MKSKQRAIPRQAKSDPAYRYAPDTAEASREQVIAAWFAAKAANPKITQREFEVEALGRDPKKADGRYLRLILEDKRSGRILVREGYETPGGVLRNVFNVRVRDANGEYHSMNIHPEDDTLLSRLDVPLVSEQLRRNPSILEEATKEWARRYNVKIPSGEFEVRRVVNARKSSRAFIPRAKA